MKYVYLFTAVLVYIQVHIQLWEYAKKDGKKAWRSIRNSYGVGVWLFVALFISFDIFIIVAVLDKWRIGVLNQFLDHQWGYLLSVLSIVSLTLLFITIGHMLYIGMKIPIRSDYASRKQRRNFVLLLSLGLVFLGFILFAIATDTFVLFLDGVAWHVYKLLLFLGIVNH